MYDFYAANFIAVGIFLGGDLDSLLQSGHMAMQASVQIIKTMKLFCNRKLFHSRTVDWSGYKYRTLEYYESTLNSIEVIILTIIFMLVSLYLL